MLNTKYLPSEVHDELVVSVVEPIGTKDGQIPHTQRNATGLALSLSKGFTLIELLIVMVILGILTTIVASSFSSSQEKAHDARRKSDLESLAKALEVYYNDNNRYPPSNAGNFNLASDCSATGINPCNWGGEFKDAAGTIYMTKIPEETSSARRFYYATGPQNQSFGLFARLENDLDRDIPKDGSDNNQFYSGSNCGPTFSGASSGCNYSVHSTNTKSENFFPLVVE